MECCPLVFLPRAATDIETATTSDDEDTVSTFASLLVARTLHTMPRLGNTTPLIEFASDHVKWHRGILEVISRMLSLSLGAIIVIGFLSHFTQVCLFAGLFMACGEDCFSFPEDNDFDFEQMFTLSVHTLPPPHPPPPPRPPPPRPVHLHLLLHLLHQLLLHLRVFLQVHTFTTVGYGSVFPTCPRGQLLVLVEEYTALIAQLVLGALILLKVMTPHASVRFATSVLISPCQTNSGWQLNIRFVNQSRYALVHGKAQMRMLFQDTTGSYTHLKISLVAGAKALMLPGEPWTLRHIFDASSPIEIAMGADRDGDGLISDVELHQMLEKVFAIDVSLSFVDPVYGPKVSTNSSKRKLSMRTPFLYTY